MAPSILDAARSVQRAVSTPQGSLSQGGPLLSEGVPSWGALERQSHSRLRVDALRWPQSRETYEDMRRDGQVQGLYSSAWEPILHMEWYVDPARSTGSLAEEIAEDLGLPLGDAEGEDDGRGLDWQEHARTALLAMAGGHRFFEETGEIRDGKYRLTGLYDRPPMTIQDIRSDDQGLVAVRVPASDDYLRQNPGSMWVDIPAEHLVPYVWRMENGDWSGRPVSYGMWRSWLLKDQLVRSDVTTKRRFGGIPVVQETRPDVTPEASRRGAEMAMRVRSGELSGLSMPEGQELRLLGVQGAIPDAIASVEYHDRQMARAFMQMFAELGNTQNGSRALGETLVDHYALGVLAAAHWLRKSTMVLVRRIADRNYGRDAALPQIRFRHDDHADYTVEQLGVLIDKGVITVDDEIEDMVRSRGNLPRRPEGAPRPQPTPPALPPTARRHPTAATDDDEGPRAPSPEEVAAGLDVDGLLAETRERSDALLTAWDTIRATQVDQAVQAAMAAATPLDAAAITVPPAGADIITQAMRDAAEAGAAAAVAEAAHQGVDIDPPDIDALHDDVLAPDAEARAHALARGLSGAAADAALAYWGTRAAASAGGTAGIRDLGAHVRGALDDMSAAGLRRSLGAAIHGALNQGRFAAMAAWGNRGDVYASELTDLLNGKPDPACCGPCEAIDGTKYTSLKAARADYPFGGYVGCEGRDACRGTLVVVKKGETP